MKGQGQRAPPEQTGRHEQVVSGTLAADWQHRQRLTPHPNGKAPRAAGSNAGIERQEAHPEQQRSLPDARQKNGRPIVRPAVGAVFILLSSVEALYKGHIAPITLGHTDIKRVAQRERTREQQRQSHQEQPQPHGYGYGRQGYGEAGSGEA
ncbi:MAG: hypothetical protein HC884_00205 [Chloroflexaceae bacterium]|nr:hypothetical protein [Chloroflexaceae bacterium]